MRLGEELPIDPMIDYVGMLRASSFANQPGWPELHALVATRHKWQRCPAANKLITGSTGSLK